MTISTVLPALCSGALEDEGKRDAVAVRAGAAVPLELGVAVGAVTVGRGVEVRRIIGVRVGRGVGSGAGVCSAVGQLSFANLSENSSKVYSRSLI